MPASQFPRRPRARPSHPEGSTKTGFGLWLVYAIWAITLLSLNYFLGNVVAAPLGKIATLVYIPLLGLMLLQGPVILLSMKSWVWYPPFALLLVAAFGSLPIVINLAMAKTLIRGLVLYYAMAVATAFYVRTPRQALPIIALMAMRFLWWAVWGRTEGRIDWHPTLANYDGFGGLMVMGAGICFWFAMATPSKWRKVLLFLLAGYCVLGVVASQARGAFLALVAVGILVWLRSPRKLVTTVGFVLGAVIIVAGASLLFEENWFWQEMASAFEEGTEQGTGQHRWTMWMAATEIWTQHPIFGVGPNNWGIFAAEYFKPGEILGFENPNLFWGINLHSTYFQILSELGLVGVIAFIWLMVDFLIKNRALHRPDAQARWAAGGVAQKWTLNYLALGLEAGLLGVFIGNAVYASFFESWFVTLWACNRMLWAVTRPEGDAWPSMRPRQKKTSPSRPRRPMGLAPPAPAEGRIAP